MRSLKIILYAAAMVILAVVFTTIFRTHPEVQLAFFFPGIFILFYSKLADYIFLPVGARLRLARGR